jgi:hypothetical protein
MKTYLIPVYWTVSGTIKVKADSLVKAIKLADISPLPKGDYIDGSYYVKVHFIQFANDDEEIQKEAREYYEIVGEESE